MKRHCITITLSLALLVTNVVKAQTVADFDSLTLDSSGFWNGSDLSGGFLIDSVFFENTYDTAWGSWSGFGYANHTDVTTAGWANQYSTYAGEGYQGSANFVIANINSYVANQITIAPAQDVQGFYIANSTYAALSMRDGDVFAKAFGADTLPNGDDTTYTGAPVTGADFFKVIIYGINNDSVDYSSSVEYFLADYQYADDSQDYILEGWEWVDLTDLGQVSGLHFELASSDTGQWGMNTPAYFCMENLIIGEMPDAQSEQLERLVTLYPNPATNQLNVRAPFNDYQLSIHDNTGKTVLTSDATQVNISSLQKGMYVVRIATDEMSFTKIFIKN